MKPFYLLLLFFTPFIATSQTPCHPDFDALIALYNSTDGPNWTDNTGWIDGAAGTDCDLCNWYGVGCSSGRVNALFLYNNNLTGSLPVEVGDLSGLDLFSGNNNSLSGEIPSEFGTLINLAALDLSDNQFEGSIPSSLGNLSNIQFLILRNNQLSDTIPAELGNLINLHTLYLNNNQLSGCLDSTLLNLCGRDVDISNNPDLSVIGTFSDFCVDRVNSCTARTSHPDYVALMALYNATDGPNWTNNTGWVDGAAGTNYNVCNWYGIGCTNGRVNSLVLNNNQLNGMIPPEIGDLNLTDLRLNLNQLSGSIPPEIGDLNLTTLFLYGNQLSGSIPIELGTMTNLLFLLLDNNQLTGTIPPELGNLPWLSILFLNNNQLTGTIPPELGNLSRLGALTLDNNQLTGTIPPELANLPELVYLLLSNNQLTGTIPPELGNLPRLHSLDISNNQLSGSIPITIGNLTHAETILFNDNQLSGCFPTHLSALCGTVDSISMSNNVGLPGGGDFDMFCTTGAGDCNLPLSACHPDFAALTTFYATTSGANWTVNTGWIDGTAGIDCDVCNWYGVTCDGNGRVIKLELENNNLTGGLPSKIEDLIYLEKIDLKNNTLVGLIPAELGTLNDLKIIYFQNNEFRGNIPTELGSLINLEELILDFNNLSGEIPSELGNLTNLENLLLHRNYLVGNIPAELGNLTSLTYLNLSYNQLSGCLPQNLSNLCAVAVVNISDNWRLPERGDFAAFCTDSTADCDAVLNLKVMLNGPYDSATGLMKDDLRAADLLPHNSSSSNQPNIENSLENITGADAIVDWVIVELRPVGNLATIQATRDLLVQRDGDIVTTLGNPLLYFWDVPAGDYQVAIRHRNHLGVLSQTTITVN